MGPVLEAIYYLAFLWVFLCCLFIVNARCGKGFAKRVCGILAEMFICRPSFAFERL